jgi:hypothetical protein
VTFLTIDRDGMLRARRHERRIRKAIREFAKPGTSITSNQRLLEGDYAHLVWSAETPDNSYELASDTFVIQGGSIQMRAFTAKIRPKH